MNRTRAYQVLGVEETDPSPSLEVIKRQYRIRILKYHPDKNPSPEAADRFRETKEAYDFLQSHQTPDSAIPSYEQVLKSFLSTVLSGETNIATLVLIRLLRVCRNQVISYLREYLRKIDRPVLQKVYDVLHRYQDAFHLPPSLLSSIQDILSEAEECIVLHPSLDDLFLENIYKLKHGSETFLVPLWHQDMVYDLQGKDLHVKCFPILPDHMELDEWNNLYVHVDYTARELWGKTVVEVEVGGRIYTFEPSVLRFTDTAQHIICQEAGISAINVDDAFDVSVKQHVELIVHVSVD